MDNNFIEEIIDAEKKELEKSLGSRCKTMGWIVVLFIFLQWIGLLSSVSALIALVFAVIAVLAGHHAQYTKKKKNIDINGPIYFCLSVGYFYILVFIFVVSVVNSSKKKHENEINRLVLEKIPYAKETLKAPDFKQFDGLTPGMSAFKARSELRKIKRNLSEKQGYLVYNGSELGENTRVTVWGKAYVEDIRINHILDKGINKDDCIDQFKETLKLIKQKYGEPYYYLKPVDSSDDDIYRYYFCFGDNKYMYHELSSNSYTACSITTSFRQGLCSRAIYEFYNPEYYSIDALGK